jgi:hypothetical protein
MVPEVDEHLVAKKFGEFKVNPPEVGKVDSQIYVPPILAASTAQWTPSTCLPNDSPRTASITLVIVNG